MSTHKISVMSAPKYFWDVDGNFFEFQNVLGPFVEIVSIYFIKIRVINKLWNIICLPRLLNLSC